MTEGPWDLDWLIDKWIACSECGWHAFGSDDGDYFCPWCGLVL